MKIVLVLNPNGTGQNIVQFASGRNTCNYMQHKCAHVSL